MERSVKLKPFHIENYGVTQSWMLYPKLLDAVPCTKHMLFIKKTDNKLVLRFYFKHVANS